MYELRDISEKEWKIVIESIKDPIEMLRAILENEDFLGYDPYFGDLRAVLLNRAKEIVKCGIQLK